MFLLFTTWEELLGKRFEVPIAEITEIQNIRGLKKKKRNRGKKPDVKV